MKLNLGRIKQSRQFKGGYILTVDKLLHPEVHLIFKLGGLRLHHFVLHKHYFHKCYMFELFRHIVIFFNAVLFILYLKDYTYKMSCAIKDIRKFKCLVQR